MKLRLVVIFLVGTLAYGALLVACGGGEENPEPESVSGVQYKTGSAIPTDKTVDTLAGIIVADVASLTRQVSPATGNYAGWDYYARGAYAGPEYGGKGFVRLYVEESTNLELCPPESICVLKTEDTKVVALLPGDRVTFRCRRQYEALSAVVKKEEFASDSVGVWELDYCRMETPRIMIADDRQAEEE